MTMTDADAPAPAKPKRKYTRRKARATKPKLVVNNGGEFAGLTKTACCNGCKPDRCVISQTNYCAHPFKGGLQTTQLHVSDAIARYARAKEVLRA